MMFKACKIIYTILYILYIMGNDQSSGRDARSVRITSNNSNITPTFVGQILSAINNTTNNLVQRQNSLFNPNNENIQPAQINNRVGFNKNKSEIKGFIDIDNISFKTVTMILSDLNQSLLESYSITEELKPVLSYNGITDNNIKVDLYDKYRFALIHVPLKENISQSDIIFDHVENDSSLIYSDFSSKKLILESFEKIHKVINELYSMIYLEKLSNNNNTVLSFIENLADESGSYLCSIRCLLRYNNLYRNYNVYFVLSYFSFQSYLDNFSYQKELNLLIDRFSVINRFLNYCRLVVDEPTVKQNLLQGKTNDGTKNTFTGFIDQYRYSRYNLNMQDLFCYIANTTFPINYLLEEKYPYWTNVKDNKFLPKTDLSIDSIAVEIFDNYKSSYGEMKLNYSFPIHYYFENGIKVSFVQLININGTDYIMGAGVNLVDIISESIILKGDNKITGNLSIIDEQTNNYIFDVNTVKKQLFSVYNTGIGTNNPKSKLDIVDCGLVDVIDIIDMISVKCNQINFNINGLRNYIKQNGDSNLTNYFNTQYIDPLIDGTKQDNLFKQSLSDCITMIKVNIDQDNDVILSDVQNVYSFYYPQWHNKMVKEIIEYEQQDKQAAKMYMDATYDILSSNFYFDGSLRIAHLSWIGGIRLSIGYGFRVNNVQYVIRIGVDIQNKLSVETNNNIMNFINTLVAHGNRTQLFVSSLNPPNYIINKGNVYTNEIIKRQIYNYPSGKLFKYVINVANIQQTTIQELDINNYSPLTPEKTFESLINSEEEFQLKNKLTLISVKLLKYYSAYWNTASGYKFFPFFTSNTYGLIHCEDDYYDYVSVFFVKSVENKINGRIITFYSFETKLVDVINHSVNIQGDFKLTGDLYVHDKNLDETFLFTDADNRFFGLNTTQVYGNYSTSYATTTNNTLAKHNCYIRSKTYPNTVIERTAEKEQLLTTPDIKGNYTSYFYFKNYSSSTFRRHSNYFNFSKMAEYSKLSRSPGTIDIPNAFGYNKPNVYCYGTDINYEVKDQTGVIKELGCLSVGIENVKENGNINGAFYVNVNDKIPGQNNIYERNILYVSNDSNLYANNLTSNGLVFGGHPDQPRVDPLQNKLWVDDDGNLRFGNKKVILQD